MKFTKMQGAGNDYVYINLFETEIPDPVTLAQKISHRRYGVGSDGLILIAPSQIADVQMIMYNYDGSQSEMCGNGIRCVGKYVWDHQLVDKKTLTVETGAGVLSLDLITNSNNKVESVRVSMGIPELKGLNIPSTIDQDSVINYQFDFADFKLKGTLVSMGNPHFVTYVDDVKNTPVESWGPIIENSDFFPNRVNIEFVQVVSKKEVIQRTWERGAGETWACGTGASAVCVAGVLNQKNKASVLIHLTGGDLNLNWDGPGTSVIKEGPAVEVYTGYWEL
ncbi:MAG: diaminopimelate epimerase [Deltaproteobacteria bacterium]|nr:diaminopimelate epimerase [Deltaproteobacteria bacterium]MBT4526866.1 diaminopimelate epimerase [Deltaproteobacteria bacterium]